MQRINRVRFGVAALVLVAFSTPAHAQNAIPAAIAGRKAETNPYAGFGSALALLSEKYQTALVCESAPFQSTLSPKDANALQNALDAFPTREAQITAVARAYDYEPVFVDARTVVLLKQYSGPQDLPEITMGEAVYFLNKLHDATAHFQGGIEPSVQPVFDLLRNAKPTQQAAYAEGVRWNALPSAFQKRFIFTQIWSGLSYPLSQVDALTNLLNHVQKPGTTVFKRAVFDNRTLPVYEVSFQQGMPETTTQYAQIPLTGTLPDATGGRISVSENGPIDSTEIGKDDWKAASSASVPPYRKTLKQVAEQLNARLSQNGETGADSVRRVEIPASLEEKNVSLFGAERFLSPVQTLKAAALTQGLRAGQGSDGVARIFLPAARPLSDPGQIFEETVRLMPASLYRALTLPAQPNFHGVQTTKAESLCTSAVKRLRVLVEPKIAASGGNPVPLEALPSEAKNLIALYNLLGSASAFKQLTLPQYDSWSEPLPSASTVKIVKQGEKINFEFKGLDDAGNITLYLRHDFYAPPSPKQK